MIFEIELIHVLLLTVPIIITIVGAAYYIGRVLGDLSSALKHLVEKDKVQDKQITDLYENKRNERDCESTHALLHKNS